MTEQAKKSWTPLESNPDVLNSYCAGLGLDVTSAHFEDVFGLDEELLAMVPQPVTAVIMCFPVSDVADEAAKKEDEQQAAEGVVVDSELYYMKQTVGNACGTIAMLHSIANNRNELSIGEGSFLSRFLDATATLSADERAAFLESPPPGCPNIEEAHHAAASVGDSSVPDAEAPVDLHFVAFVHRAGKLWQLDGRRTRPVCHGASSPTTLLQDAAKVVAAFAEQTNSISFNLLALTKGQPQ